MNYRDRIAPEHVLLACRLAAMVRAPRRRTRCTMGRSQVVRQRILIPPFGGSSPPAPANDFNMLTLANARWNCAGKQRVSTRQ